MAMINIRTIKTNTVIHGGVNTYCKMCMDKSFLETGNDIGLHDVKTKLAGKLLSKKVYKMRLSGVDFFFCAECWNTINKELNPSLYEVKAEEKPVIKEESAPKTKAKTKARGGK